MDADASVKAEVATITGLPTRTGKLTTILDLGTARAVRKMLGVDVTSSQVDRFGNFIAQLRDLVPPDSFYCSLVEFKNQIIFKF